MIRFHVDVHDATKRRARIKPGGRSMYADPQTDAEERMIGWAWVGAQGTKIHGPVEVHVEAIYPVPTSWTKTRQADALAGKIRPTARPDLDNQIKIVLDALERAAAYQNDSNVVEIHARKIYGPDPGLWIEVRPL